MLKPLKVQRSITLNSTKEKVWDALTNLEHIKQYFFGTETKTDWKVGSPLIFEGEFEEKKYRDKGRIIKNEPGKLLRYSYWSGFSGLEDKEENYSTVTYEIKEVENGVELTVTQEGFANEEKQDHAINGWKMVLDKIKEIVEK